MIFNIITPCSRTYNLAEILLSILEAKKDLDIHVNWLIAFDGSKVAEQDIKTLINFHRPGIDDIDITPLYVTNDKSVSGNAQRNEALDLVSEGFVYFLDDDNIIHPEFLRFLLKTIEANGSDIGILCPQLIDNYTRIRTIDSFSVKVGGVDIAQFCVPASWVSNTRWTLSKYVADGIFLCTIYKAYSDRFIFAQKPLAYYNKLQEREITLSIRNCGGLGGMLQSGDLIIVNEKYVQEMSQPPTTKKQRQTVNALRRVNNTDLEVLEVGNIENKENYIKVVPIDTRHPAHKKGAGLAIFFERPEDLHNSFTQTTIFGSEYGFERKINIGPQWSTDKHRSGWGYAMTGLRCLHTRKGIDLDGFVENNFSWTRQVALSQGVIPYHAPWVGFIHNPHNMPTWFGDGHSSNQQIFSQREWRLSLKHCKGLFTLSNYHKKYIEQQIDVPVVALLHPTETPDKTHFFDINKFTANKNKGLVQVGWWLRKPYSLYRVPTSLKRSILNPGNPWQHLMRTSETPEQVNHKEVKILPWKTPSAYDELLSKNIVFLDLFDSSANNAVIECIVRNTPVLVNPLEAIQEYLGKDYPFYFTSFEEAGKKSEDLSLIKDTVDYLSELPIKKKLTQRYFLKSFAESTIYKAL